MSVHIFSGKNWKSAVYVVGMELELHKWWEQQGLYPHWQCGTRSLIRSSILLQASNIFGENWKHTCLGKPNTPASENYWRVNLLTCLLTYP